MNLPLSLDVQGDSICIYTHSKRSFLGDLDAYLIYTGLSESDKSKNNFEKKFTLKEHAFPLKQEDCILIPINLFELNKPYEFIIDSGKTFYTRACVLRQDNQYRIKKVNSTESCDE